MGTCTVFGIYFLGVLIVLLLAVCADRLVKIESRIKVLNMDFSKTALDLSTAKLENTMYEVYLKTEKENKDKIELRKYCLNNVPGDIGIKSRIDRADMLFRYIATGKTKKGSDTSKKQEL